MKATAIIPAKDDDDDGFICSGGNRNRDEWSELGLKREERINKT